MVGPPLMLNREGQVCRFRRDNDVQAASSEHQSAPRGPEGRPTEI